MLRLFNTQPDMKVCTFICYCTLGTCIHNNGITEIMQNEISMFYLKEIMHAACMHFAGWESRAYQYPDLLLLDHVNEENA